MKSPILLPLFLLLIHSIGFAQSDYEIINVIPSPTTFTGDLTHDGNYLYLRGGNNQDEIFKIDPELGIPIDTLYIPLATVDGITYGNDHFWVGGFNIPGQARIYKLDPASEEIVDTLFINPLGINPHGMQFIDNQIAINMFTPSTTDTTYIIDLEGNVISKYHNGLHFSHGIAHDGCKFWKTANFFNGTISPNMTKIVAYDTYNHNTIDTIDCPGGGTPNGLVWFEDHLWVADNLTDSIFQLKLSDSISLNTAIIQVGDSLIALQDNASYTWLDCENEFQAILNENNQIFLPSTSGIYAVDIQSGCRDTSACIEFLTTNTIQHTEMEVQIFPNPSLGLFHVQSIPLQSSITLYNSLGELKISKTNIDEYERIDLNAYPPGIYYLMIENGHKVNSYKLLKI